MAGWSFVASGLATADEVVQTLDRGLQALKGLPGTEEVSTELKSTPAGWAIAGNGNGETFNDHQMVLNHVQALISDPAAQAGSSEFNGPHVSVANFHQVPVPSTSPPAPAAAPPPTG